MLHLAICDDQTDQIQLIKTAAERYLAIADTEAVITTYNNSLMFLEALPQSGGFDLLLLDICMPGILGTDVAREIRQRKDKTEIIFLTTSTEFAVEAFALDAAHYIVKPFTQAQFDTAMNKVILHLAKNATKRITIRLKGGNVSTVDVNDIAYLESYSHTQIVCMASGICQEARHTLSELYTMLEQVVPGQFIVPYKGYLVNQNQIRSIADKQIVMRSGSVIPIPKRNSKEITNQFFDWRFGGGNQ